MYRFFVSTSLKNSIVKCDWLKSNFEIGDLLGRPMLVSGDNHQSEKQPICYIVHVKSRFYHIYAGMSLSTIDIFKKCR